MGGNLDNLELPILLSLASTLSSVTRCLPQPDSASAFRQEVARRQGGDHVWNTTLPQAPRHPATCSSLGKWILSKSQFPQSPAAGNTTQVVRQELGQG